MRVRMYVSATEHEHADRKSVPKGRPKGRPRPRQPTRAAPALPLATACGRRRGRPVAYPPNRSEPWEESPERGGSSKVPPIRHHPDNPSPRGSVRTATALPDRRNATAGPGPIRPRVRLAPPSGRDISQAPRYPSLGMACCAQPTSVLPVDNPEDPRSATAKPLFLGGGILW